VTLREFTARPDPLGGVLDQLRKLVGR
jgi:hypothetical protein